MSYLVELSVTFALFDHPIYFTQYFFIEIIYFWRFDFRFMVLDNVLDCYLIVLWACSGQRAVVRGWVSVVASDIRS